MITAANAQTDTYDGSSEIVFAFVRVHISFPKVTDLQTMAMWWKTFCRVQHLIPIATSKPIFIWCIGITH